jgi:hypothetical protein
MKNHGEGDVRVGAIDSVPSEMSAPARKQGRPHFFVQAARRDSTLFDRMWIRWNVLTLLTVSFGAACCPASKPRSHEPQDPAHQQPPSELTAIPELESRLSQRITFEGLAVSTKTGAVLKVGDYILYMDGMDSWPDGWFAGDGKEQKVIVTGTLVKRYDLPVFIQEEGAPTMSGMPMPPGTDLHDAARRYLLTDFTYERVTEHCARHDDGCER